MRRVVGWSAIVATTFVLSCSRIALVPARGATTEEDVTVEARTLAWTGTPRELERTCTAVLVEVENGGRRPIAIARDSFSLLAAERSFQRLLPDQIAGATPEVAAAELKPVVLEPGENARGFVYFERVADDWGTLAFRTSVVDAESHALVDTIDIPFRRMRLTTCDLAKLEDTAPWSRGEVFDTCLLPQ